MRIKLLFPLLMLVIIRGSFTSSDARLPEPSPTVLSQMPEREPGSPDGSLKFDQEIKVDAGIDAVWIRWGGSNLCGGGVAPSEPFLLQRRKVGEPAGKSKPGAVDNQTTVSQ